LPNFPGPYQEKIKIFNKNGKSERNTGTRYGRNKAESETQTVECLTGSKHIEAKFFCHIVFVSHSHNQFSHSPLCPECAKKLYPELNLS
jgi:hypothetical protein